MSDKDLHLLLSGQADALADLCRGLAAGRSPDAVIDGLRAKVTKPPGFSGDPPNYARGYGLIVSIASLVRTVATRCR
jgi:hypothetical protein